VALVASFSLRFMWRGLFRSCTTSDWIEEHRRQPTDRMFGTSHEKRRAPLAAPSIACPAPRTKRARRTPTAARRPHDVRHLAREERGEHRRQPADRMFGTSHEKSEESTDGSPPTACSAPHTRSGEHGRQPLTHDLGHRVEDRRVA
jgi:hypothetical protein